MSNNSFRKILVVDDEEDVVFYLSNILRHSNYEVISTTKGKEAVELATYQHPDLIILDIVMPDMSGDGVAAILRENPSTANIPIIFLTVIFTKKEEKILGRRNGKYYIMAKPAVAGELLRLVSKILPSKEQYYKAMASEYFAGLEEAKRRKKRRGLISRK